MIDEVFEIARTKMINQYCTTDILDIVWSLSVEQLYKLATWFIKNQEYIKLWSIFIIVLALYDLFSYYRLLKMDYENYVERQKEKMEKLERKWKKFEKMVDKDLTILFDTIEALHTEIAEKKSLDDSLV